MGEGMYPPLLHHPPLGTYDSECGGWGRSRGSLPCRQEEMLRDICPQWGMGEERRTLACMQWGTFSDTYPQWGIGEERGIKPVTIFSE